MANASDLRQRLITGAENLMREAVGNQLFEAVHAAAPYRTGDLYRSGYAHQIATGDRISWLIGFTAPQAQWTNDGVDPHTLGAGSPDEPGSLRHWVSEQTGEDIFRRYTGWEVATPATHWFDNALAEGWPAALEDNLDVLEAAFG